MQPVENNNNNLNAILRLVITVAYWICFAVSAVSLLPDDELGDTEIIFLLQLANSAEDLRVMLEPLNVLSWATTLQRTLLLLAVFLRIRITPNWFRNCNVTFDSVRNIGRPVESEPYAPLIKYLVHTQGYAVSGVLRWLRKLESMFCFVFFIL